LLIFVFGAVLGGQLNRGIYRLAWRRRDISPWSEPPAGAPPRRCLDLLPILGWLGLRREWLLHGRAFWVRPLLIELASGAGLAVLYWWEVEQAALLPQAAAALLPQAAAASNRWLLHAQYAGHVALFALMLVATFIDFDEKTIPDAITVPGALLGLVFFALVPAAAPPIMQTARFGGVQIAPLLLTSPDAWSPELDAWPGLAIGVACLVGWCLAIWPKTATLRRGWTNGVRYLVASMFRWAGWQFYPLLAALGSAAITAVWYGGAGHWHALLTSLVGLAFGGGLIWAVRIVGGISLQKEAMGFGDVTLMAMIGVYVGWQASLLIFFLAPFVAVAVSLAQWIITRRRDIPYGPYLCIATALLVLWWSPIWEERAKPIFSLGWLIPALLLFCLVMLGGLLRLWRLIEDALFGPPD
jgi:prepilin signal peptidase PulO-like enzyme (type II secretory pathway)